MGTINGLRYPEPSDPARDGALAIRRLAEDVDGKLANLGATYATDTELSNAIAALEGRHGVKALSTLTADSAQFAALTSVQSAGLALLNGVRYRIEAVGHIRGTVAGDIGRARLFQGTTANALTTQLRTTGFLHLSNTGSGYRFGLVAYVTGAGSTVHFSTALERVSGTGNVYLNAAAAEPATLALHAVGPA